MCVPAGDAVGSKMTCDSPLVARLQYLAMGVMLDVGPRQLLLEIQDLIDMVRQPTTPALLDHVVAAAPSDDEHSSSPLTDPRAV